MSATETKAKIDDRPRFSGAWETRLLGDLGQTYGGLTGKSKDDFGHGEGRFVTFLNAIDNVRLRATLLEPVDVAAGDRQNVVQPGDVIFNGTSETPGELAMGSLVPDGFPAAYLNSFCFGFRTGNDAGICSEFVAYLFRGRPGRRLLAALAQGATRYNLSKSQFRKLALSLPGLPEQRAIAAALSDVDDLLQSLNRLIAKKRDIKTGAMQQLLTGKTRLPGFSGAWETKRLGEVVDRRAGTYLPRDSYAGGRFSVHGAGGIMGHHDRPSVFEPSTVLGRIGTIGSPRFEPEGCWVNNNAVGIVPRRSAAHAFFVHCLLTRIDWSDVTSATAQPFLVLSDLLAIEYEMPPLPEQRALATVLSDMDAEIDALEARRTKTAAIKQGMMQELLTGRTRLPIPQEHSA